VRVQACSAMSTVANCLTVLRDFVKSGKLNEVKIEDDVIRMGEYTFPRTEQTAYKSRKGRGKLYTLVALVFFLQNCKDMKGYGTYLMKARKQGIMIVPGMDQMKLRDYLTGKDETSEYVDEMALLRGSLRQPAQKKAPVDEKKTEPVGEKPPGMQIIEMETVLEDRNTMLCHPTMNFSEVVRRYKRIKSEVHKMEEKRMREMKKKDSKKGGSRKHPRDSSSSSHHHPKPKQPKLLGVSKILKEYRDNNGERMKLATKDKYKFTPDKHSPIIIVPSAASSLITIYNVKQFLEGKQYFPSREIQRQTPKKPRYVHVKHKSERNPAKEIRYVVIDDPRRLSYMDWQQVVAVFVTGADWQLSYFPFKSPKPAEVFSRICGFHLNMKGVTPKKNIGVWNVKKLEIGAQRYGDKETVYAFWQTLIPFQKARFPHLYI